MASIHIKEAERAIVATVERHNVRFSIELMGLEVETNNNIRRSMANRRVRPEVQQIFEKYMQNNNLRRLSREDAIHLFQCEFKLDLHRAEEIFDHFDTDQNGSMSLWEFQHFYTNVGPRALEMIKKFEELDKHGNGYLDVEELWDGFKAMKTSAGQPLQDREVEFFCKSALKVPGNDKCGLGDFIDTMTRIHLYKRPTKK